jgi:chemotaxis protein histidine kinase CheA/CheY-like chemotaxis protein
VLSTRMLPVSTLVPRLRRNVRQTAQTLGKEAELVVEGESIMVDGDILNSLADPLLHILRNAVDHGIEFPDEREARGKPRAGLVTLHVSRQGNGVTVRVTDDGKGLDYQRIREKGVARGLLGAEARPTQGELARLTLQPGFSTRDQVSEVSGRGVGMDVVAARISALKGSVDIRSETGAGCEVELRFQASLATQHALLVRAGGQVFAVPSYMLDQALAPGLGDFLQVGNAWSLRYGNKVYPVRVMADLVGGHAPEGTRDAPWYGHMCVLLARAGNGSVAIAVEEVLDGRDLIIKGVGRYLNNAAGVAGVSVLGDGTIAPLLDLNGLLQQAGAGESGGAARARARLAEPSMPQVLVVDDSLSVRKSLANLLADFSYQVTAVGDGMEAVRALEKKRPDIVLTDLEMPNMNGIELTEYVRRESALHNLPVVMITSRSMDKHRDMATRAGVDVYLTKPYTDADLLGHIQRLLAQGRLGAGAAPLGIAA